ncbi:MAG: hypothetical protein AAGG44_19160, partial [Planctomycetota bacterium]
LAAGDDRGGVYVWPIPPTADSQNLPAKIARAGYVMRHGNAVNSLHFNDGGQLLIGAGNSVRAWRLTDNQPLTPLISIEASLFDARWLQDNSIEVFSKEGINDARSVWKLPALSNVTESSTGELANLFESRLDAQFETLVRTDAASESFERVAYPPDGVGPDVSELKLPSIVNGYSYAANRDESRLVFISSLNDTHELHIVDRYTLEPIGPPQRLPFYLEYPRMNAAGTKWIANNFRDMLAVGDIATGKIQHSKRLPNWIVDAKFVGEDEFAAVAWDYRLRIWNSRGSEIAEFEQSVRPEFMTAREHLIAISAIDQLYIYRRSHSGQWSEVGRDLPAGEKVQHLAISPKLDRILTCGEQGTSKLWSDEGIQIAEFVASAPVKASCFSPDGRWLAALNEAGNVQIRCTQTGELMGPTLRGRTPITCVEWPGPELVIAGNNYSAGYWVAQVAIPENWHSN